MDIVKEIVNGENRKIELKSDLSKNYNSFLKTVVAFANGSGGKIIFGVNDKNRKIVGLSDEKIFLLSDKVSNLISEKCYPTIIPEIYIKNIENKNILVVEIFPGQLKLYYLKESNNKTTVYIRIGATTRKADPVIIKSLERERLNLSFDEEIIFSYEYEKVNFKQIKEFFYKNINRVLTESKMLNLKILKEQSKKLYLTRGRALLLGMDDDEFSSVKCARFNGKYVIEFIDSKKYSGPLYEIMEKFIPKLV